MEDALKEAFGQLVEKKYESRHKYEGYEQRLRYGIL